MTEHPLDISCSECGGDFRMVWLSGDPPEPYGLVCDCPDPDLADARAALHQHYVDWDGEPEDAVRLQLARSRCDAIIAAATGETPHEGQ